MSKTITAPSGKSDSQASSDFDFAFDLRRPGVYEVTSQPLPYGFQFSPKGKGLPLIVVSPHGDDRTEDGGRRFLRADWAEKLRCNVLVWWDPTAALNDEIRAGFGLGSAEHWALPNIAHVVGNLRTQLGIRDENIVFAGFSGGGFASLLLASHFSGASCLVNNPDAYLLKERRHALTKVAQYGYPGLTLDEIVRRFPERTLANEALKSALVPPHIYLLQNAGAESRFFRTFLTSLLGLKAREADEPGGTPARLVLDYYTEEDGKLRPAKPDQWARSLEAMADWFATPAMTAARIQAGAPVAAPVQQGAPQERWSSLLPTEVAYWDAVISGTHRKPETVKSFRERAAGHYPVPAPLVPLIDRLDIVRARILDVGSGPHTTIGPVLYGTRLNIVAVDPLADDYNELLARYEIEPTIRTIPGEAESLVEQFGKDRFDIVHSRNALDHSRDLWRSLQQMVDVCVPGGVIYIEGSINEGLKQGYHGLHQWNMMPADGDVMVWNSEGSNLASRMLTGLAQIRTARKGGWFSATMLKEL